MVHLFIFIFLQEQGSECLVLTLVSMVKNTNLIHITGSLEEKDEGKGREK